MIENDYLLAWAVYLGSSLVFLLLWWLMTAGIGIRWLQLCLRLPPFALLLTPLHIPMHSMGAEQVYAPAIAAIAIDLLAGHDRQALQTVPYLTLSVFFLMGVGFLYLYCFPEKRKRSGRKRAR